jgi:peptidoglycan/xylan/chitin deacetylase (PgdA/CDA1 family)
MNNNSFGIMFHYFHKGKQIQGSLSSKQFEDIIKHLEIVPAKEWLKTRKGVCLTFDDGLINQYQIALPILKKYNLTAFWFINSAPLVGDIVPLEVYRYFRNKYFKSINEFYEEFFNLTPDVHVPHDYLSEYPFYSKNDIKFRFIRDRILDTDLYHHIMDKLMESKKINTDKLIDKLWMNSHQIQDLHNNDHIIGLHSHTHPTTLSNLTQLDQLKEYKYNLNILMYMLGDIPTTMSHPCNSYSNITLDILKRLGIKLGFRSNNIKKDYSLLEYPRKDCMLMSLKEKE